MSYDGIGQFLVQLYRKLKFLECRHREAERPPFSSDGGQDHLDIHYQLCIKLQKWNITAY